MFNYNIHPLVVHFPIAFLFVYAIIKILPMSRWFPKVAWMQIERVLLLVGVLGAFAALATGDTAERIIHPNRALVDAHSNFGSISTWIFGAMLFGEIIKMLNAYLAAHLMTLENYVFVRKTLFWIERIFSNRAVSIILAVTGLVCISITGLLGGVIADGLTADPVAPLVLKLLGISL